MVSSVCCVFGEAEVMTVVDCTAVVSAVVGCVVVSLAVWRVGVSAVFGCVVLSMVVWSVVLCDCGVVVSVFAEDELKEAVVSAEQQTAHKYKMLHSHLIEIMIKWFVGILKVPTNHKESFNYIFPYLHRMFLMHENTNADKHGLMLCTKPNLSYRQSMVLL